MFAQRHFGVHGSIRLPPRAHQLTQELQLLAHRWLQRIGPLHCHVHTQKPHTRRAARLLQMESKNSIKTSRSLPFPRIQAQPLEPHATSDPGWSYDLPLLELRYTTDCTTSPRMYAAIGTTSSLPKPLIGQWTKLTEPS